MNRIVLWVLSTVSSLVLLLGYHTSTAGPGAASSAASSAVAGSLPSGTTGSGSTGSGTTVTGSVASTQWGPVQVELTLTDGTISSVQVLQQPSGNPKDEEINSFALPQLVRETLDAQSADIDMVSGATVTSAGYLQSLQSALDQVGA